VRPSDPLIPGFCKQHDTLCYLIANSLANQGCCAAFGPVPRFFLQAQFGAIWRKLPRSILGLDWPRCNPEKEAEDGMNRIDKMKKYQFSLGKILFILPASPKAMRRRFHPVQKESGSI
jgi:hypothetical protein